MYMWRINAYMWLYTHGSNTKRKYNYAYTAILSHSKHREASASGAKIAVIVGPQVLIRKTEGARRLSVIGHRPPCASAASCRKASSTYEEVHSTGRSHETRQLCMIIRLAAR